MTKYLFDPKEEWTEEKIQEMWEVIDDIGKNQLGLDYYEPQIEIVSSEQMLDAYSSIGLPNMYKHWSFGKSFIQNEQKYLAGQMNLAYELIINTNPAITYLLENNTITMQALTLCHAVCGHSSFFKNNRLFQEWTDADNIVSYLRYAKNYIDKCEKKYGENTVEKFLDSCHALSQHGVDLYKRRKKSSKKELLDRKKEWVQYYDSLSKEVWDTSKEKKRIEILLDKLKRDNRQYPEENLLYFIEKYSPQLPPWKREIISIVRNIAQYFYPQGQVKVMNEGWASYVHYTMMTMLHEQERITDGSYLEFLANHTGVCYQPAFYTNYYSGINPYALGFAIFKDLERLIKNPTPEDKKWYPEIAGKSDHLPILKEIVSNYRDESFLMQYLSPKVIRDLKISCLHDDNKLNYFYISEDHSDEDIHTIRRKISQQYSRAQSVPQIEIVGVDWNTDRALNLHFVAHDNRRLERDSLRKVLAHIEKLWGRTVLIDFVDSEGNELDF